MDESVRLEFYIQMEYDPKRYVRYWCGKMKESGGSENGIVKGS